MKKRNIRQGVLPYVFLILFVVVVYFIFSTMNKKVNTLTYDEFIKDLNAGEVTELEITPKERSAVYTLSGKLKGYEENETFTLNVPYTDAVIDDILNEEEDGKLGFKLSTKADPDGSTLLLVLVNIVPYVILIGIALWFFTRQVNVNSKSIDFGRSKARLSNGRS